MSASVLIIDDEPAIRASFSHFLTKVGFAVTTADSLKDAREKLSTNRFDTVLLDVNLPDGIGLDFLIELRENWSDMAVVVITGVGDVPMAVEAMRRGADHFLTKPVNMSDLEVILRKGMEVGDLRRQISSARRLSPPGETPVAESPVMRATLNLAELAAQTDTPVLLTGETGTGKGLLARWIHARSRRHAEPFVDVNCSSLQGELLASELFGHVRGAFTSAVGARQGLIEVAHRGTLFLDEIGEMDHSLQSRFLKILEEKRFRRLGESQERHSDFRLLCATNRDLEQDVRDGRFRKDLFFRIHVMPIALPPLRERLEDLPHLVAHFLQSRLSSWTPPGPEVMSLFESYSWPGNVRELRSLLERATLLSRGGPLGLEHFPGLSLGDGAGAGRVEAPRGKGAEAARMEAALARAGGHVGRAAAALGISRATLYRRLKKRRS